MRGEHPDGPHRSSTIMQKENAAGRAFERGRPACPIDEAAQMTGLRFSDTSDAEGEPRRYRQNPHDE